jgi:peroxiredoxin
MLATLTLIPITLLLTAAEPGAVTELHYTGRLVALPGALGQLPVKDFEVNCWVSQPGPDQMHTFFLVQEQGAAIAWPERFGQRSSNFVTDAASGSTVRVLYVHNERRHLLGIEAPYFAGLEHLAAEAQWSDENFHYTVGDRRDVQGRDCWQVQVRPRGRGPVSTISVEAETGLIVRGSERLTIGQGEPHELTWELDSSRALDPDAAQATLQVATKLVELQTALDRDEQSHSPVLRDEQLALAADALPELLPAAAGTPFARLVDVISRDVQAQRQRGTSLAELAASMVGKPAPEFSLTKLNGTPVPQDQLSGKTVVLHFWSYRDEPLEEPYGQVGYLDFLLSRHQDEDLVVYGVAVDPRLSDGSTAPAAIRSIRRLMRFMNLGYEVTMDPDGSLLNSFGDPTQFGAELPLWLVIGPDGKLAHFRTGYYEIDRDTGLKDLDEAVSQTVAR